ncbi:hypothetical protein KCP75_00345 [Salmonella enterica subsp. enterica]|nr:hypothetical protein KCP75_00345 [Salmonella enterica subsp. enterica]
MLAFVVYSPSLLAISYDSPLSRPQPAETPTAETDGRPKSVLSLPWENRLSRRNANDHRSSGYLVCYYRVRYADAIVMDGFLIWCR